MNAKNRCVNCGTPLTQEGGDSEIRLAKPVVGRESTAASPRESADHSVSYMNCERCSQRLRVPDGYAGRQVKCPKCGHSFVIAGQYDIPIVPTAHRKRTVIDDNRNGKNSAGAHVANEGTRGHKRQLLVVIALLCLSQTIELLGLVANSPAKTAAILARAEFNAMQNSDVGHLVDVSFLEERENYYRGLAEIAHVVMKAKVLVCLALMCILMHFTWKGERRARIALLVLSLLLGVLAGGPIFLTKFHIVAVAFSGVKMCLYLVPATLLLRRSIPVSGPF